MIVSGSGRGKIILFGEHSAVHGYPAVGIPLDCEVVVTWEDTDVSDSASAGRMPNPGGGTARPTGAVHPMPGDCAGSDAAAFGDLLAALSDRRPPLGPAGGSWRISGGVPRAGGFGSSAALCVALARIALRREETRYHRNVHVLANELEKRFHGTPSGIDTGLASDEAPAAWLKSAHAVPDRLPLVMPEQHLLYGALPRSKSTGKTVATLSARLESGDGFVSRVMEDLGKIAEDFIGMCKRPGESELGGAMNDPAFVRETGFLADKAQSLLASLGLSTPDLEEILRLSRRLGAVGGKLSGGGMGGAFFLCAPDRAVRDHMTEALTGRIEEKGIVLEHPLTPLDIGG